MEPTRDEAGTDRDRLAAVTEKKGGPGVPEPGRADEEAPPAVEEGPLKAGGRTGEEPEPDTAGQDPPRSAGRTGVFPEIAAGWARTLGAITEEIPIVVIEDDGEERAPRADDEPAEDPGAAEDSGADEEDPRDAGGGAEDPEPGGDAVEGPFDGPEEAVREEPAQEMPEAADETRVVEESAEISQAADEPAQEAPEAGDVGVVPDRTEELPVVVETASPPEVSEPVELSDAAAEPPEGLEEADGEDVPRAVEEPAEAPDAAVEAPEADEGSSEGLEADEGEPHDAGSGDSRGAVSAPEAGDVGVVPDRTEELPVVAEAASPPEVSEAEERPSDGLEESVEEEPAADPRDAAEDAVEGSPEGLGESGEEVPQAVEGPSAAPWDTASPAAAPRVADVSGASEADGRDTRGAGPAQEIPEAGEPGEPEEAEEPAEAGQAPDVTTLRAAETPDAAPVDLPAAKADLPPSYPPPRRSRRARARSGSSPRRRRRWIPHRSTILVVVIVVALTALFKTFVIQWFEIPSGSMENTLEVGDEVAVTMYDAQDLERGDVVVFTDPDHWLDVEDPTGLRGVIRDTLVLIHLLPENTGHYLIKRVIGVAGDHIVADGRGSLTVNGAPLDETYLKNGTSPSEVAFDVVVPEGFVWVMGDNRSNSADSRYHQDDAHGGFVPIDDVAGVAKVVVWPIGHWRGLGDGHEAFKDVPEPGRAPAPAAPAPEDGA